MRLFAVVIAILAMLTAVPGLAMSDSGSGARLKPLVMGVFPRRDPLLTIRLFKPLQRYLEEQLQRPVLLETAPNFDLFNRHLDARRYDLVHFNQLHYIEARERLRYDVLVQNEEFNESTIRAAIYTRGDSGIDSVADLRGQTVLFGGGKKAMISYMVPRYLLLQLGLEQGSYQEKFARSPPNAVLAVYQRQVKAAGAGLIVARLPVVTDRIDTGQLKILATSEPLTHLPWAVKTEMPEALKSRLRQLMIDLKQSVEGREVLKAARLTAFNPATDADYDVHRNIIRAVHEANPGSG